MEQLLELIGPVRVPIAKANNLSVLTLAFPVFDAAYFGSSNGFRVLFTSSCHDKDPLSSFILSCLTVSVRTVYLELS